MYRPKQGEKVYGRLTTQNNACVDRKTLFFYWGKVMQNLSLSDFNISEQQLGD